MLANVSAPPGSWAPAVSEVGVRLPSKWELCLAPAWGAHVLGTMAINSVCISVALHLQRVLFLEQG